MEIMKEKIVFNKKIVIEEGELINETGKKISRLRIRREDVAVVLLLNTETHKVVLTRQFRYPVALFSPEQIIEAIAGKVNEGEEPLDAAIRETEEETGYRINPKNIKLIVSCFASPGYTTERFFIYHATVDNADKATQGGGIEEENIEVVEMDVDKFKALLRDGAIHDAKTYIAGLYLLVDTEIAGELTHFDKEKL